MSRKLSKHDSGPEWINIEFLTELKHKKKVEVGMGCLGAMQIHFLQCKNGVTKAKAQP